MTKMEFLVKDLIAGIDDIGQRIFPDETVRQLKNCLKDSIDFILAREEAEVDFGFFEDLEQKVRDSVLNCSHLQDLSQRKRETFDEELNLVIRALDYKYSGGEPQHSAEDEWSDIEEGEDIASFLNDNGKR